MNLPMRRQDDDRRLEQDFEQMRRAFVGQLERWPDFIESLLGALPPTLDDVMPLTDLEERDDSYVLEVELPGVKRDDIDLQIEPEAIRLTAERRERERVGWSRHRIRTTGRFALQVALPTRVDPDAVTASLEHGLLTVVLPKSEPTRRRRIPVGHRG